MNRTKEFLAPLGWPGSRHGAPGSDGNEPLGL